MIRIHGFKLVQPRVLIWVLITDPSQVITHKYLQIIKCVRNWLHWESNPRPLELVVVKPAPAVLPIRLLCLLTILLLGLLTLSLSLDSGLSGTPILMPVWMPACHYYYCYYIYICVCIYMCVRGGRGEQKVEDAHFHLGGDQTETQYLEDVMRTSCDIGWCERNGEWHRNPQHLKFVPVLLFSAESHDFSLALL